MTKDIIQSGKIEWYIKVHINQEEFAKLPIDVFPDEPEAINTAKYNIVNELISNLKIEKWGVKTNKKGIHRAQDECSNKPMFSILGE